MKWNWEQPGWPKFTFDAAQLRDFEARFLLHAGELIGAFRHVGENDRDMLRIELIGDEAVKTSEIEGEILNRESVQSSLRHQFGIGEAQPGITAAERGVTQMMVDLYRTFADPLTDQSIFGWHKMLLGADGSIEVIGGYRTHARPMQVVSGPIAKRKVHFEAPPSSRIIEEMAGFVDWFNETAQDGRRPLPALTRAGLAHLYFVSIHPFEDGNGRIGRALAEKSLAQNLDRPSLIALAYTIQRNRKAYYEALERNNKSTDMTDWLKYFSGTVLEAQHNTIQRVDFYVAKAKFYRRMRGQFNDRQQKAIARMFREGIDGFKGGLSAEKYVGITQAARATATRDLQDLVTKGALNKTGELRHTRYHLNLADRRD
jgi:Fic family protein